MPHLDRRLALVLLGLLLILTLSTATQAQDTGTLEGLVVNGTAGGPEVGAGVTVTLYVSQGGTEAHTFDATTGDGGRFRFDELDTSAGLEYWPEVEYLGVPYRSAEPYRFDGEETTLAATITVFETTGDDRTVDLNSVHFIAESFGEVLRISEIHLFGNSGDRTYVGQTGEGDSLTTVRIPLPENAMGIAFEQEDSSERFIEVEDGIIDTQPVLPGQETSMVFFSYHLLVMGDTVPLERIFAYPLAHLNLLAAQPGLQLNSEQLEMQGPQSFQGRPYDLYATDDLPADAPLAMVFVPVDVPSDSSAASPGAEAAPPTGSQSTAGTATTGNQELLRWLGFGLVALAIVGVIVYGATRKKMPAASRADANLAADPEARQVLAKLADLEDAFEAGQVDEAEYARQRAELHEAIKSLQS